MISRLTDTMVECFLKFIICTFLLSISSFVIFGSSSCFPYHFAQETNPIFQQKTDRFWEFDEQSNSWVEVKLPFDLVSCVNGNCSKVGSISQPKKKEDSFNEGFDSPEQGENSKTIHKNSVLAEESSDQVILPVRKRISLTKMSETSMWLTGESGSIYERFWNGVQWVIAPHDLPTSAGSSVSVFIVNQTILALSESGNLYQMQLSESSQPVWIECTPTLDHSPQSTETEPSSILIKSGIVSYDRGKIYFSTIDGSLLELSEVEPWRWIYHGRPPGANVAAIADAATIRPDVVFTVSSIGDLYELDRNSKPSWKKHIWSKGLKQEISLKPSKGCIMHGLIGTQSISLFLLTKDGDLVERRLHQRKWGWIVHGSPKNQNLTSITAVAQDELNEKIFSLFFTTATGSIFEYQLPRHSGGAQGNQISEKWVNHMHPLHAKAARGIVGLQCQVGRILFPLDDGRLAELHLFGIGGEGSNPTQQINMRRKTSFKYEWLILETPETEGWNAEYCTEERGPSNCITGIKDEPNNSGIARPTTRRRKPGQPHQSYLVPSASESIGAKLPHQINFLVEGTNKNFRMRVMHTGRSFFLVTDSGVTFEYLYAEDVWLWLKHEHPTIMKGVVGSYNGSLFLVDLDGNLLIRERSSNELTWKNCTAIRKGRQVIGGPPWDKIPGKSLKVTTEDALFFVSKNGRLLQFTVALRKFKWKDCRHPLNTRIACIVDQETLRANIIFVIGRNGRLYQYNKLTKLWHEHYQSPHLVLSRLPGTAMRPPSLSLTGSLFMISEDGGLVEYHWNPIDGWCWVEHGTPSRSVNLVSSPGPCFESNQLFLIGSDGEAYLRYMDQSTWKWKNYGFPPGKDEMVGDQTLTGKQDTGDDICVDEDSVASFEKNEEGACDAKVAPIRPIPFSEDSVIFELQDGRLAELRRVDDTQWIWSRTIGTPTSQCMASYWTAVAS
ncbi:uncharacterized protein LOC122670475 isoform X1 [Telopea speciosissima]|uniref:uncharacterized protein LOC122670475 isoform X1 n=1 Tax=Telopea speciosissima TaxID=54955 RepID=UPI001CC537A5|nr:uncharacterized protein LOC122670475 isoform X1 [Telopea speciosissima]